MDGVGRSQVLAVLAPDPVMSVVAPVGLAASLGTALVIDHAQGQTARTARTLSDVVSDGPRLDEISPGRSGVATIAAGHLGTAEVAMAAETLASRWPAVVVRVADDSWPGPIVPVHILYGPTFTTWTQGAAVWQPTAGGGRPPAPGPVLPALPPRLIRHVLRGWMPSENRWVRAWKAVWGMPWG